MTRYVTFTSVTKRELPPHKLSMNQKPNKVVILKDIPIIHVLPYLFNLIWREKVSSDLHIKIFPSVETTTNERLVLFPSYYLLRSPPH